jgi:hypothetical protein
MLLNVFPHLIPGFETIFACDHGLRIVQREAQGICSDAGFEAEGGQCMKPLESGRIFSPRRVK